MTRPRIRAALLATGAGLATGYTSVSDFTGVIHGHYTGAGAAGLPAAGQKDALGHRAVAPPSAGPGQAPQAAGGRGGSPLWPGRRRPRKGRSVLRAAPPRGGR